ncbi:beta-lactamase-like protein [Mycena alexandri]|uniref:Beta-lactamase-like protein n=1 Tax=Mycena alexandri TaxID=1745969 RepID=A0AAD6WYA4_9AGAR|nr:beta-lactamase-like protein [Mycena alexandri]KAJ7027861.1 beta-lactamase-like protein [Mycena alexandri]
MRLLQVPCLVSFTFFIGETYASYRDFGIPTSSATVEVRAFNVANITFINQLSVSLIGPILPGRGIIPFSDYAFFVEHTKSGKRLMFDLGTRIDPMNYAPSVVTKLFTEGIIQIESPAKDIFEFLGQGGIPLDSISTVIWSHSHFDHVGDMSKFPNTTELVIGPETGTLTYPQFPKRFCVDFAAANLSFGSLTAIDYFGDRSFYLLDTPGHLPGHLTALARVTPTSFVHLGGDSFHNAGELRPRPELSKSFPCPAHLLHEAKAAISTNYFWSPKSCEGAFDLRSRAQQFLVGSDLPTSLTANPIIAGILVDKIAAFDADADFFVIAAHNVSLRDSIPYFPATLNNWKALNMKDKSVWNFVDKKNPAFLFSPM